MSGRLYLFRYVPDLARGEARNLGVAMEVETGDGEVSVLSRLLDPAQRARRTRESRALRSVVGEDVGYEEWFAYWSQQLARGPEGLRELLERQKQSFPVSEAGQIWEMEAPQSGDASLQRYFERLVFPPEVEQPDGDNPNLADKVIQDAGLPARGDFHRGFRVPSYGLVPARTFKFPYALVNGHTTVMARLPRAGDATVEQALYRFEHIAADVRKIALIDTARTRNVEAATYLEDVADVVDVSASNAVDQLLEALD